MESLRKNRRLSKKMAKKYTTDKKYTYLIKKENTDEYKIGKSINPMKRIEGLQTASSDNLELIQFTGYIPEVEMQRMFSTHRKSREWFVFSDENIKNKVLPAFLSRNNFKNDNQKYFMNLLEDIEKIFNKIVFFFDEDYQKQISCEFKNIFLKNYELDIERTKKLEIIFNKLSWIKMLIYSKNKNSGPQEFPNMKCNINYLCKFYDINFKSTIFCIKKCIFKFFEDFILHNSSKLEDSITSMINFLKGDNMEILFCLSKIEKYTHSFFFHKIISSVSKIMDPKKVTSERVFDNFFSFLKEENVYEKCYHLSCLISNIIKIDSYKVNVDDLVCLCRTMRIKVDNLNNQNLVRSIIEKMLCDSFFANSINHFIKFTNTNNFSDFSNLLISLIDEDISSQEMIKVFPFEESNGSENETSADLIYEEDYNLDLYNTNDIENFNDLFNSNRKDNLEKIINFIFLPPQSETKCSDIKNIDIKRKFYIELINFFNENCQARLEDREETESSKLKQKILMWQSIMF